MASRVQIKTAGQRFTEAVKSLLFEYRRLPPLVEDSSSIPIAGFVSFSMSLQWTHPSAGIRPRRLDRPVPLPYEIFRC